jgi:lipopolysaccharide transport system ATP-binding protein
MPIQKKCLGKMDNIARHGRTVLFVSHNMQAISQLCARAVLLNEGLLVKDGPTQATINTYIAMTSVDEKTDGDLSRPELRDPVSNPNSLFKWRHCSLINSQKQPTSEIRFGEPFEVTFQGYAKKDCENIIVGFGIFSKTAGLIFVSHQIFNGLPDRVQEGISEFHIEINPNLLTPGLYELGIAIEGPGVGEWISNAMQLHVLDVGITPDKTWNSRYQGGVFHYPCKWRLESKI